MMKKFTITLGVVIFVFIASGIAHAIPCHEGPDAGDLMDTAKITHGMGSLDYIYGSLMGNDVDLYQIFINNTSEFSVTVQADLSYVANYNDDNDAVLYLFDSEGHQVLSDDDDGNGLLPQFNPGEISGQDAGIYYLSFTLFGTWPEMVNAKLFDWHYTTSPQTGDYTLTLTKTSPTAPHPTPEPATILLFGFGLVGIVGIKKRFRT